eukprot:9231723-Lingulodinium_polyedra.AAC.1
MPRAGVGLYVGTYPCSFCSRRGRRTGFCHPDAQVSIIGMKRIVYIFPQSGGEVPSQVALNESMENIYDIVQGGVASHTIQIV